MAIRSLDGASNECMNEETCQQISEIIPKSQEVFNHIETVSVACGSPLESAMMIQLKIDGLLTFRTAHLSWQAKGGATMHHTNDTK